MYTNSSLLVALASLATLGASQKCKVQFDGRVPKNFSAAKFDTANGIFNPSNVMGKGLKFSEILKTPAVKGSLVSRPHSILSCPSVLLTDHYSLTPTLNPLK